LHIDVVMALNEASHEPQSRSIACLVSSDVVSGPGVSSIGSLPRIIGFSFQVKTLHPSGKGEKGRKKKEQEEKIARSVCALSAGAAKTQHSLPFFFFLPFSSFFFLPAFV
jgi:hypothetical protein